MPVVKDLFTEYEAELAIDLCFQDFQSELQNLPGKYSLPEGVLLLVTDETGAIACGALRKMDETACELKRIYVRPSHRGLGLGRQITIRLIDAAEERGYKIVRLDTLRRLIPANGLYASLGFTEIEPFNVNPEADVAYFERQV